MARLGSTGRRLQPSGLPPGAVVTPDSLPRGSILKPGQLPQSSIIRLQPTAQQQALTRIRQSNLPSWARSDLERQVWEGLDNRYKRPLSVLGAVFRVLGVGENVAVGALQSASKDVGTFLRAPTSEKILGAVSPWTWIAAHAPDNFVEIKNAVAQNRTYDEWIRESQDPGSFLYENAFVIGLGLAIFGDPTTYLTFGTTSASKAAGTRILAASYSSTADEAADALLTGVIRRTGEDTGKYANNFDRIFHRIHTIAKRPYTTGDALEALNKIDKGQMPDIDQNWLQIAGAEVKPRGPVRGALRKQFARGGQGLRFAGAEVPGTRGLKGRIGERIGRAGGPTSPDLIEAFQAIIPDAKLKTLTDDAVRAVAMTEFTRANQTQALARSSALIDAVQHFALDPIKSRNLGPDVAYRVRAQAAVRNIFDDVPTAVPKRDRAGLLKPGWRPSGKYGMGPLQGIRQSVFATRDRLIQEAEDLGMTQQQVQGLHRLWDDYVKNYDDPVDVLARFESSLVGTFAGHELIEQIIRNPLLVRPSIEGADELAHLEDEMKALDEKLATAVERANEKGISARSATARQGVVKRLQERSQLLSAQWNAVNKGMREEIGTPPKRDFVDEIIKTPEGMPDVTIRKGKGWKAVWSEGEPPRIPTDEELIDKPWLAQQRVLVNPKTKDVWIAGNEIDHAELVEQFLEKEGDDWRNYLEGALDLEGPYSKPRVVLSGDLTIGGKLAASIPMSQWSDLETHATKVFEKVLDTIHNPPASGVKLVGALSGEDAARAAFHENAVPFTWKGQKYWTPAPVAHAIDQIRNPQLVDKEIRKWYRTINFTQNKWKILATSMNPRFHVMNMVGGMWNNLLGGVYNPGDYAAQYTALLRQRMASMNDESFLGRALGPMADRIDPEKLARDVGLQDAAERRLTASRFISHEVHPEFQEMKRAARGKTSKFTVARRTYAAGTLGLWAAPDEWVPDDIEDSPLFSPLAGVGAAFPEIARAGKFLASDVETVLRETPMRIAQRDPSYYQLMDALSIAPPVHFGEWMGRMDIGATEVAREVVWDIGATNALKYQFDYGNLTNFERYAAKTIFPFYVWNKNNFVLQVSELANRPRFLAVAADVMNFLSQSTANEDNEQFRNFLPEYFDKLGMVQVPVPGFMREIMGLPQDQDLYLNPTLPYASLNLFPAFWEVFNDESVTPTNNRWLQTLAPIFSSVGPHAILPMFKPMVEYSIGYNLGLARPLDYQSLESGGWRHSYREAPSFMRYLPKQLQNLFGTFKDPQSGQLMMDSSLAYVAEQMASPFINSSGDLFNWGQSGGEADKIKANNFAFITGVRLTPVDPVRLQRSWLYRAQSWLEGRKGEAKRRGEIFSREDELMLRRIRAQLKVVDAEYDRQQATLYGKP